MDANKKKEIKEGTKLIFIKKGSSLTTALGNVFTFSRWVSVAVKRLDIHATDLDFSNYLPGNIYFEKYFQCKELLETGNKTHYFPIDKVDVFDENIYTDYVLMTPINLQNALDNFKIKITGYEKI